MTVKILLSTPTAFIFHEKLAAVSLVQEAAEDIDSTLKDFRQLAFWREIVNLFLHSFHYLTS